MQSLHFVVWWQSFHREPAKPEEHSVPVYQYVTESVNFPLSLWISLGQSLCFQENAADQVEHQTRCFPVYIIMWIEFDNLQPVEIRHAADALQNR